MNTFFNVIRSTGLKRGPGRWLGGICSGIAEKFNFDVTWVRIVFLLTLLIPVATVPVYLIAWLLLPLASDNTIVLERFIQNRRLNK